MRKVASMHINLPPTIPQKILFDHLPGATLEFMLPKVGGRIDVAIPSSKLAIEVDGVSHRLSKQKERDAKKEQALKERGWTLLRFQNAEILGDLSSVLTRIEAAMTMLQKVG
jgi:very-short-patch-repair endonuclease